MGSGRIQEGFEVWEGAWGQGSKKGLGSGVRGFRRGLGSRKGDWSFRGGSGSLEGGWSLRGMRGLRGGRWLGGVSEHGGRAFGHMGCPNIQGAS